MVFSDSDVYKWLEAALCLPFIDNDDKQLKEKIDTIQEIRDATDGYINTYLL